MNNTVKCILVFVIIVALALTLTELVQPLLNETSWSFIPVYQVLMPFLFYYLFAHTKDGQKYRPLMQWVFAVAFVLLWACVSEMFNWDKVCGKLIAHGIGSVFAFVYAYIQDKKYVSRKRQEAISIDKEG